MSVSNPTSRRFFLGAVTAAAATRVWGANDKINVAIIGLGGRGSSHVATYPRLPDARVAGLCDIDQAARERAQATLQKITSGEKVKAVEDMRELFADPGIDAVSIAAPNHWHALATIWACQAGKDVYSEKPACYNIHEGLRMVQVAHETKRMVQIGSQHRSMPFKIRAIEAMQGGLIGKIYMAKGLCFKRRRSIGHKADSAVPPGVNWDLFLGPAPQRPFNELRFKYNWHWFWDTGNGDIGNQGVHEIGICRWALGDPEWPKSVFSSGGKYAYDDDQETPNTQLCQLRLRRARDRVRGARHPDRRRRHAGAPHGWARRPWRPWSGRRSSGCTRQSGQHADQRHRGRSVLRQRGLGFDG
jgi:predicted dehydrogenase